MATYKVQGNINSGSANDYNTFLVKMVIDFSQFTFTNGDILVGPRLEPGTMPIRAWQRVIFQGDANTNGSDELGFSEDPNAWEAGIALDNTSAAKTIAEITLAGDVEVNAESSTYPGQFMTFTAGGAQTATYGILEIIMLCIKFGGVSRG